MLRDSDLCCGRPSRGSAKSRDRAHGVILQMGNLKRKAIAMKSDKRRALREWN